MSDNYVAKTSVTIDAPASKVWDALTRPEMIKQYLFGTDVTTDWKAGSPITYRGVWEGKPYEDKGQVLEIVPNKLIVSTFWSALSGLPDSPENYQTVRYELEGQDGQTRVTVVQDNNPTPEDASHSEKNWHMVLEGMKKLLES